jgi:hypothetical protein
MFRLMGLCRSAGDWDDTQHSGRTGTPSPALIATPQHVTPTQVSRCTYQCEARQKPLLCVFFPRSVVKGFTAVFSFQIQILNFQLRSMLPAGMAGGRRRRRRGPLVARGGGAAGEGASSRRQHPGRGVCTPHSARRVPARGRGG